MPHKKPIRNSHSSKRNVVQESAITIALTLAGASPRIFEKLISRII